MNKLAQFGVTSTDPARYFSNKWRRMTAKINPTRNFKLIRYAKFEVRVLNKGFFFHLSIFPHLCWYNFFFFRKCLVKKRKKFPETLRVYLINIFFFLFYLTSPTVSQAGPDLSTLLASRFHKNRRNLSAKSDP